MPIKLQKLPAAVRWGLAVLCAAACGVLWAYYWRVFFGLDNRVSPLVVTLGCAAFLEVCLLAGYCVRRHVDLCDDRALFTADLQHRFDAEPGHPLLRRADPRLGGFGRHGGADCVVHEPPGKEGKGTG